MKYRLAIFDMDGTILNTLDDLADSTNHILEKYNFPLHSVEEIRFMVGNGIPKLIERALPAGTDEETFKKVLEDFLEYYREHSAIKTAAYPGIAELIKKLKSMGVITAVNTNKDEKAALTLCEDYFPGLFDIISGSRPGLAPKPCPDAVFEILSKAGLPKDTKKAVFIGDSDVDLQTGINAGLETIGVVWGFRGRKFLEENGARQIAEKPEDIFNFF